MYKNYQTFKLQTPKLGKKKIIEVFYYQWFTKEKIKIHAGSTFVLSDTDSVEFIRQNSLKIKNYFKRIKKSINKLGIPPLISSIYYLLKS